MYACMHDSIDVSTIPTFACVLANSFRTTCIIHVPYMYHTCTIHVPYMYTCIIHICMQCTHAHITCTCMCKYASTQTTHATHVYVHLYRYCTCAWNKCLHVHVCTDTHMHIFSVHVLYRLDTQSAHMYSCTCTWHKRVYTAMHMPSLTNTPPLIHSPIGWGHQREYCSRKTGCETSRTPPEDPVRD